MKSTKFFSLFLLCAFFTRYLPSATADLVDTDGNLLENGGIYNLIPVIITGNGGGVEFAATGNETCPLTVVQNPDPFCKGLPVQISTLLQILYLSESFPLFIGFTVVPPCARTPSTWTAVKGEGEGVSVKLVGYENTVPGWFQIKSVPYDIGGYNILFCAENGRCDYVGVELDGNRNRRLLVTKRAESALWVRFQKLSDASTATVSVSA